MSLFFRLPRAGIAAAIALCISTPAGAAYFPRADGNAVRSLSHGLGVQTVPILRRQSRESAAEEVRVLIASLPTSNPTVLARQARSDRLRILGQTWQLDVFGDGSAAEFIDSAAAGRARALRVAPSRAPSGAQLENAGRLFITRYLSKVIVPAPGERLVPDVTSARTETGVRADGSGRSDAVVANRIVFTREIHGIPVVGAGSKVTITFSNDGSIESYRYDWPAYIATGRVQPLVASPAILQRVQRVMSVRARGAASKPILMPRSASALNPLLIAENTQLERLECGYYDPGLMNRAGDAPVQAGCYYHAVHYQGEGDFVTAAAFSGAVPAAVRDEADLSWPEAAVLRNLKTRRYFPPPASAAPGTHVQPVPSKTK